MRAAPSSLAILFWPAWIKLYDRVDELEASADKGCPLWPGSKLACNPILAGLLTRKICVDVQMLQGQ